MKSIRLAILLSILVPFLACEDMGLTDQVINLVVDKDESLDDNTIQVKVTVNRNVGLNEIQDVVEPIIQQGLDVDLELPADVSLEDSIVPGVGIDGIKIGDTLERVQELYGEPTWLSDFTWDLDNPWWLSAASYNLSWWNNEHIQISYL